uniref:Kallikrein-related protein n=1 Tax=Homo sapiens TaxID=9606 RepID=B1GRN0_HUMAN|nr:kallikrein-related protein [Homo sapiens]
MPSSPRLWEAGSVRSFPNPGRVVPFRQLPVQGRPAASSLGAHYCSLHHPEHCDQLASTIVLRSQTIMITVLTVLSIVLTMPMFR